jgi:hypothetical protein
MGDTQVKRVGTSTGGRKLAVYFQCTGAFRGNEQWNQLSMGEIGARWSAFFKNILPDTLKATEANRKRGPGTREKVRSKGINLEGNTHAQEINVSQLPV